MSSPTPTMKSDKSVSEDMDLRQLLDTIPPKNVYTRMNKTEDGRLICISNLGGCPKENRQGDDITQTPCKNSTYQAIGKFLRKNKKNRVVFQGNFFGDGPYTMTMIHNMMALIHEFNYNKGDAMDIQGENQVSIVLGPKDVNVLRLKYELHKLLQQQKVEHPELEIEMKAVIKYRSKKDRKQEKAYGNYIPYNYMIKDDFRKIYSHVFVSSIYQRVKNILMNHGGYFPHCILFDKNFSEFYHFAKNEQNIELMLLTEQLSVFTLLYAFVPEVKFDPYLSTEEVFHVIKYLLGEMNIIIEELRSYRSDIYVRQLYESHNRMKILIADHQETHNYIEELMPLENWRTSVEHFYHNSRLLHYDETFHAIFLQFDPTYTLPTFINCFIPFSEYVREDPDKIFVQKSKPGEEWSIEHYYQRWSDMYEKFLSLKMIQRICNPKDNPYLDFMKLKKTPPSELKSSIVEVVDEFINEENERNITNNNSNNSNTLTPSENNNAGSATLTGGGKKKYRTQKQLRFPHLGTRKSRKKTRVWSSQIGGARKKNKTKADFVSDELSFNSFFDSVLFNETIVQMSRLYTFKPEESHYQNLYMTQVCRYVNRHYRNILKYPNILQSDVELNQFIFIQMFYLFLLQNKGRISPFNGKHIRKNKELLELFKLKKIYHIFIANIDLNFHFSIPFINIYGVNFIFVDKLQEVKKKFDTPRRGKFLHDSYEDFQLKELLKLYNYPIVAINTKGDIENTSLTISGFLKIKKSYLGPYFFHTFRNFFMLHEELKDLNLLEFKADYAVNPEGDYLKLEAYMLPLLNVDNTTSYPRSCFVDNMYFIKIMPEVKALHEIFFIIDFEKAAHGGRIGYYLGRLTQWMGFFFDRKRLYQRKIRNIPYTTEKLKVFINYYLPGSVTHRLYIPLTEEVLDIEFKDEPSLLKTNYSLESRFHPQNDFLQPTEIRGLVPTAELETEDPRLQLLKNTFDNLFGRQNLRFPPYFMEFDKLSDNEDFATEITVDKEISKSKKKKLIVTIPVNNVDATLGEELGKGSFKQVFSYNTKLVESEKQRFAVGRLKPEKEVAISDFMKEISYLIFSSLPSTNDKIETYHSKVVNFMGLNLIGDDFYFLTPKTDIEDLRKIINNKGMLHNKDYFFDTAKKSIHYDKVYDMLVDMCEGMTFLHHQKILHLDYFHRNMLAFEEGDGKTSKIVFKVTDFGLSQIDRANLITSSKKVIKSTKTKKEILGDLGSVDENNVASYQSDNFRSVMLLSQDFTQSNPDKKDVLVNTYSSKTLNRFYCSLQRNYLICGTLSDSWAVGFLILKLICAFNLQFFNSSNFLTIHNKLTNYELMKKKQVHITDAINSFTSTDLEPTTKKTYLSVLYDLLINKPQIQDLIKKPRIEMESTTILADLGVNKFYQMDQKPKDIKTYTLHHLRELSNNKELVLDPIENLKYCLTPVCQELLYLCYTSYTDRREAKEILEHLKSNKKNLTTQPWVEEKGYSLKPFQTSVGESASSENTEEDFYSTPVSTLSNATRPSASTDPFAKFFNLPDGTENTIQLTDEEKKEYTDYLIHLQKNRSEYKPTKPTEPKPSNYSPIPANITPEKLQNELFPAEGEKITPEAPVRQPEQQKQIQQTVVPSDETLNQAKQEGKKLTLQKLPSNAVNTITQAQKQEDRALAELIAAQQEVELALAQSSVPDPQKPTGAQPATPPAELQSKVKAAEAKVTTMKKATRDAISALPEIIISNHTLPRDATLPADSSQPIDPALPADAPPPPPPLVSLEDIIRNEQDKLRTELIQKYAEIIRRYRLGDRSFMITHSIEDLHIFLQYFDDRIDCVYLTRLLDAMPDYFRFTHTQSIDQYPNLFITYTPQVTRNIFTQPDGNCGYHALMTGMTLNCFQIVNRFYRLHMPTLINLPYDSPQVQHILNELLTYSNLFKFIYCLCHGGTPTQATQEINPLLRDSSGTIGIHTEILANLNRIPKMKDSKTGEIVPIPNYEQGYVGVNRYYINLMRLFITQPGIQHFDIVMDYEREADGSIKTVPLTNTQGIRDQVPVFSGTSTITEKYDTFFFDTNLNRIQNGITEQSSLASDFYLEINDLFAISKIFNLNILLMPYPHHREDNPLKNSIGITNDNQSIHQKIKDKKPIIMMNFNSRHFELLMPSTKHNKNYFENCLVLLNSVEDKHLLEILEIIINMINLHNDSSVPSDEKQQVLLLYLSKISSFAN